MIEQRDLERAAEHFRLPEGSFERLALQRDRKRRDQRIRAGAVGLLVALAVGWWGLHEIRSTPLPAVPPEEPTVDLGIFEPVAGWIVYGDQRGIWGVDPTAPGNSERVQLTFDAASPLGWSAEGTELLVERLVPQRGSLLSILHADGIETPVVQDPISMAGATISPDGSRVVFSGETGTGRGLHAVDVETGEDVLLLEAGEDSIYDPTFSPDGTRIAYAVGGGDHSHHIWVMNVDGTGVQEILFNETTEAASHVNGLAWSPQGDLIALGLDTKGIFTFAPDGSGFTRAIHTGDNPYWSPDGSQIAYSLRYPFTDQPDPRPLAIADPDGSNDQAFDLGTSGPWHPGTVAAPEGDEALPAPAASGSLAYILDGDVFLAGPDGSNAVRIADGRSAEDCDGESAEYSAEGPMWSPDGRYLAFQQLDCSSSVVVGVISDAEGNVLATFPTNGWQIAWSPDSTRVAVWDVTFETVGVYGLDGVRQAQLPISPGRIASGDHDPVWRPDGTSLMVPNVEVPLDGSTPRQLPWPALAGYTTYSPDGSRVAYTTGDGLTVARSDGSEPEVVFGDWAGRPAWSATGDRLAFTTNSGRQVQVLDLATGSVTPLTELGRAWSCWVIGFSPQGDRVLFSRDEGDGAALWAVGVDGSDAQVVVEGTTEGQWSR